jgi:hypothetical protein
MKALGLTKNQAVDYYGTRVLAVYDSPLTASLMSEQYLCNVGMTIDGWYFLISGAIE